jgi:hypothetical protein
LAVEVRAPIPEIKTPEIPAIKNIFEPVRAWNTLLKESGKPLLAANAAFMGFQDGVLNISVRSELWLKNMETILASLPVATWFPGFRSVQIKLDTGGQTNREKQAKGELERKKAAVSAAKDSEAIKLLQSQLSAKLEEEGISSPLLPGAEDIDPETISMEYSDV